MDDYHKTQEELINELTTLRQQVATLEVQLAKVDPLEDKLQFHTEILQIISDGSHLIRANDGIFLYTNPIFDQMFGYESGELIGKHVSVISASTDQDFVKTTTEITEALNETNSWQGDIQNIRKDGTIFWCHVTVSAFHHDTLGEIWISVYQDITLRKQTETILRGKSADLVNLENLPNHDLQYLIHELQVHQIELIMQNDELHVAQLQVEVDRDRHVDLYEFAPTGYLTVSDNGIILEANHTLTSMLGIEKSKLVQRPFSRFIAKEDQDTYHLSLKQAFNTKVPQSCMVQLVRNDNSRFYAFLDGKIDDTNQGNSNHCRIVVSDISERKQAEVDLHKSEARYRHVVQSQTDLICHYNLDLEITFVNEAYYRTFGGESDDLVGQNVLPFVSLDHIELAQKHVTQLTPAHPFATSEHQSIMPDGTHRWFQWHDQALMNDQGEITEYQAVGRDITERKQAETAFQESENRYGTLIEESPYCIHEINLNGQLISMNPAGLVMMGIDSEEDIIGTRYVDAVALDSQERINNLLKKAIAGNEVFFEFKGAGEEAPHVFSSNFIPIEDTYGNVLKVMGITQDITERKQAEEALSQKQTLLQTLIDAIPDYIFVIDREGRYVINNKAHMAAFNVSSFDELVDKTANDVFPTMLATQFNTVDEEVMSLNRPSISLEHRMLDSSGNEIWVSTTKVPLLDNERNVTGLVGISRDITYRKQAETRRDSLAQIVENSLNEIYIFDAETLLFIEANQGARDNLGYTLDELSKMTPLDLKPEYTYEAFEDLIHLLRVGEQEKIKFTTVHQRKDGSRYPVNVYLQLTTYQSSIAFVAIILDITARKQMEEALRKSNRAYKLLSDCDQTLIRATDEATLLNEICKIIVEVGGYRLAWVGFAEHNDAKTVRPVAQAGYEEGYLETLEITWGDTERGRGPSGTAIRSNKPSIARNILTDSEFEPWRANAIQHGFASSLALPMSIEGEVIGLLNVYAEEPDAFDTQEVKLLVELADDLAYGIHVLRTRTAREHAEATLLQEHVLLQTLIDAIPDYIFGKDREGRFVVSNKAHTAASNVSSPDELIGKTANDVFPVMLAEQFHTDDDDVMSLNQARISMERRTVDSSGNEMWVSTTKVPLLDENNTVTGLVGISRDITEQKQIERDLEEQHNLLRQIIDMNPNIIIIKDMDGKFILVNETFCVTVGKPMDEIIGKIDRDIFPNSYEAERFIRDDQEVIRTLETKFIPEESVTYADGERHWHQTLKLPFIGHDRPSVLIVAIDITERKQAEDDLRRYKNIVSSTTDGIVLVNREYACEIVNDTILERNNLSRQQVEGHPVSDIMGTEAFNDTVKPYLDRSFAGETVRYSEWFNYPTQGRRYIQLIYSPYWDDSGDIIGVIVSSRDITTNKEAQDELEEKQRTIDGIFDIIPDAINIFNVLNIKQYSSVFGNKRIAEDFGYTSAEIIAMGKALIPTLIHPDDISNYLAYQQHVLETSDNEIIENEFRVKGKDGSWHWVYSRNTVFRRHPDGSPIEILGISQDITKRKHAEEALRKSEAFLAQTGRIARIGGWELDTKTHEVSWTEETYHLHEVPLDYQPPLEEAINFYHPDDRQTIATAVQTALEHGTPYDLELRFTTAKGKHLWVHTVCNPIIVDGKVIKLTGIFQDITEPKQAEQALQASEKRYKQAEEIANIGGWKRDFVSDIAIWSPSAYRIFGVDPANIDLTDDLFINLVHPSDRDHVNETANLLRLNREQMDIEYRIVRSDQTIRTIRSIGEVRLNQAGEVIGLLGAIQDITERKQAEIFALENEHLKTQFQKEQEQTALIQQIISTLSHDMRTPLAVIAMQRDILSRYVDKLTEEKRQEKLEMIKHQIQFALQLLDDTVEMARGRHEFHPTFINLAILCQISVNEVHLAKDTNHRLTFDNIGQVETVFIDETLVSRILLNLLSNAVKYSPNGGEIRLELDTYDEGVMLSLSDQGIGIGDNDLPYIFDLLYRSDNTQGIQGTGLGLSIVKDCIDRHQGVIIVESELEKGSTFTVKLPVDIEPKMIRA